MLEIPLLQGTRAVSGGRGIQQHCTEVSPTFNINPNQPVDWSPPVCILDTWLYRPRLALDVLRSESIRYLSQFQLVLGGIEVVWIEPRTSHPLPMLSFGTPNSGGGLPDARYYSGGI